ncbi:MAG: hypothetical protein NT116_00850, partial [Candidatus Parcubacteria bacterium]|nr:hypothetical protein [Candidatus Parcubacteria bacterium]
SIILFFIFYKRQKAENTFFFLAAMLFFLLTLKSKRYVEYFLPFLVFFSAFIFKTALTNFNLKEWLQNFKKDNHIIGILIKIVLIYLAIIFPLLMVKDSYVTKKSYRGGIKFATFSGIAHYLETKTKPGEIIMHTDWDDFPPLFYYNDKDYYIMGLDPTFMYNYNPDLYKLFADITMAKKTDNLYQEIKQKFNSSYFIVDADRPQLAKNLQNDGNFIKVYEDQDGSIYAAKDVLGSGTGEIK